MNSRTFRRSASRSGGKLKSIAMGRWFSCSGMLVAAHLKGYLERVRTHDHERDHRPTRADARRRLALALTLAAVYLVAEVVGGLWTGSLALLADAGHMGSDVAALSLALFAVWVSSHPADDRWTYGRARAEILAALAQGVALVAVVLLIVAEAIGRFAAPQPVSGGGVFVI